MADARDYASDEEEIDIDEPTERPVRKVEIHSPAKPALDELWLFVRTNWDGVLAEHMMHGAEIRTGKFQMASVGHYKADESPDCNGYGYYQYFVFCDVLPNTKSYETLRKHVEKRGSKVLVFTRSLGVAREVEDLGWITLKYAADKTSSELLWDWMRESGYVDDAQLPRCTPYIHDMTVWDWKHAPESMYFYTNMQSERLDMKRLIKLEGYSDAEFKRWLERGEIIKKYNEHIIEQFARGSITRYVLYENRTYKVLMVESRHFVNEIANYLLDHHQVHVAAICYYDLEGKQWRVSLRTAPEDSIDVGVIAKQYGGGGSRSAAAFKYDKNIDDLFIDKKDVHKYIKKRDPADDPVDVLDGKVKHRHDEENNADRIVRGGGFALI